MQLTKKLRVLTEKCEPTIREGHACVFSWTYYWQQKMHVLKEQLNQECMAKQFLAIKYFTFFPRHWVSSSKVCFVLFHILYQVLCLLFFHCIVLSFLLTPFC